MYNYGCGSGTVDSERMVCKNFNQRIMKRQVISLPHVKKPTTGFNHVVKAGDFIFLSSQLSADIKTGEIIQ